MKIGKFLNCAISIFSISVVSSAVFAAPNKTQNEPVNDTANKERNQTMQVHSWPQSPKKNVPAGELRVNIFDPTSTTPIDDPLETNSINVLLKGTLVYAPLLKERNRPLSWQYFVFRGINQQKTLKKEASAIATYEVGRGEGRISDPVFSPDGQSLIFKDGDPYAPYGAYRLYLWDFGNYLLLPIADYISNPLSVWSPDSKRIAYIKGDDSKGNDDAPLKLFTFDLSTRQEQLVTQNSGVNDVSWDQQSNLLFTAIDEKAQANSDTKNGRSQNRHLDALIGGTARIVSSSVNSANTQTLIEGGIHPLPSLDGKWIAFWGLVPNEREKATEPRQQIKIGLYLFNRATTKRTLLREVPFVSSRANVFNLPRLHWSKDSRSIFSANSTYSVNGNGEGVGTVEIELIPVVGATTTGSSIRKLVTLTASDFEETKRSDFNSQFHILPNVHNTNFLFVKVSEAVGVNNGFTTENQSLTAINLATGEVTLLAKFTIKWGSVIGWDWRSES